MLDLGESLQALVDSLGLFLTGLLNAIFGGLATFFSGLSVF